MGDADKVITLTLTPAQTERLLQMAVSRAEKVRWRETQFTPAIADAEKLVGVIKQAWREHLRQYHRDEQDESVGEVVGCRDVKRP